MAKTPAAARLLLLTTLLQLLFCCSTTEPLHIHLSLDGKIDPRFNTIKNKFFKQVDAKDSDSKLADVKNQIQEKQHIRLYISGDFKATRDKPGDYWNGKVTLNKKGQDVANIVSKMIPPTAIGVVVFPIAVHKLLSGLDFLEEFEKTIQISHKDLSIGRETIHLYFTFEGLFGKTFTGDKKDYRLHSVVINKALNFNIFNTDDVLTESVYQVLIHEADTVIVQLEAKCELNTNSKLTVGGLTAQELSGKLLQVLTADNKLRHPYQKVITQLPNVCGTDEERKSFTAELMNKLSGLDASGKEPSAVLYVCQDDTFCNEVKHRMALSSKKVQYYFNQINKVMRDSKSSIVKGTQTLDVKELSIEFHCHGTFHESFKMVCGQSEDNLAKTLKDFLNRFEYTSLPPMQIVFYACNAGTEKGLKYVEGFRSKLENDIREIIAFTSWTAQSQGEPMITVAEEDKFKASTVIDGDAPLDGDANKMLEGMSKNDGTAQVGKLGQKYANYAFGRFTVKVRKNKEGKYFDFPVLPKTELHLDHKVQDVGH